MKTIEGSIETTLPSVSIEGTVESMRWDSEVEYIIDPERRGYSTGCIIGPTIARMDVLEPISGVVIRDLPCPMHSGNIAARQRVRVTVEILP